MRAGKCTRPLRLPHRAPRCWISQESWNRYRAGAEYSAGDGFTYCTDCCKDRQTDMIAQGRCAFPRTVFHKNNGTVVGKRVLH